MEKIIRLTKEHHKEFVEINRIIRNNLVNSSWFMPFSEENLTKTFDDDSTLTIYGTIVDGTLACVSLYDTDEREWIELCDVLGVKSKKVAELGGSMVLPEYRGKNLMQIVNQRLVEVAKESGLEYLVATAHPDNIASNKSLTKLGMECKTQITRAGKYLRNVYMMKL